MSDCTLFFKSNGKIKIPKDFKLGPFRWVKCMLNRKTLFGTLYLNKNASKYLKTNKQNKQKKQLLKKLKNKNIWYFTTGNDTISYYFFRKSNISNILKFILSYEDRYATDDLKLSKFDINYIKLYKSYYNYYLSYNSKFSAALYNNFFFERYIHLFRPAIEKEFNINYADFYTHENLYIFLKKHTNIIKEYYNIFILKAKKYCLLTDNKYNNDLKEYLKKIKSAKTFKSIIMGKYVIKDASKLNMNMFI